MVFTSGCGRPKYMPAASERIPVSARVNGSGRYIIMNRSADITALDHILGDPELRTLEEVRVSRDEVGCWVLDIVLMQGQRTMRTLVGSRSEALAAYEIIWQAARREDHEGHIPLAGCEDPSNL